MTSAIATTYEIVLDKRSPISHYALIDRSFEAAIEAMRRSQQRLRPTIQAAAQRIHHCFARGGKLLIAGNGGSAADAQHFAAELVGRFSRLDRAGLPALALTADSAFLTAWSNDVGYADVFARQVKTFAQPEDLLIGISTSGRSPNLIAAFAVAQQLNLETIAILGGGGGELRDRADLAIVVPATDTPRIQEVQILVIHLLCELVEAQLTAPMGKARSDIAAWDWDFEGIASLESEVTIGQAPLVTSENL